MDSLSRLTEQKRPSKSIRRGDAALWGREPGRGKPGRSRRSARLTEWARACAAGLLLARDVFANDVSPRGGKENESNNAEGDDDDNNNHEMDIDDNNDDGNNKT